MKKLFTALVIIISTHAFAQQGTIALGVNSGFGGVAWTGYALSPNVGYFISDKMMVGTSLSMRTSSDIDILESSFESSNGNTYTESFENTTDVSSMSMAPFVRYYISDKIYVSGGISMTTGKEETKEYDGVWSETDTNTSPWSSGDWIVAYNGENTVTTTKTSSSFGLNAGIGYTLMWNDRIFIEPAIGFSTRTGTGETETTTKTYDFVDETFLTDKVTLEDTPPTIFDMGLSLSIHIRL